jgi:mediator of RNA polymerase II transcription subunit 13
VEGELRQEQHLVVQDASRSWVWLFRAATVDQIGQKPLDLPLLEGYSFQRMCILLNLAVKADI